MKQQRCVRYNGHAYGMGKSENNKGEDKEQRA